MLGEGRELAARHVAGRDDPDEFPANREGNEQASFGLGSSQGVKPRLIRQSFRVRPDDERSMEEDFLCLPELDIVLEEVLLQVASVPVEALDVSELLPRVHGVEYTMVVYTLEVARGSIPPC